MVFVWSFLLNLSYFNKYEDLQSRSFSDVLGLKSVDSDLVIIHKLQGSFPFQAIRMAFEASLDTESKLRAKTPNAAALQHRNQVPTRQPAPSRRPDHRPGVTYTDPLVQEAIHRSAYPTVGTGPGGRNACPGPCNVMAPTPRAGQPQCKVPLQVAETTESRKSGLPACGATKPYTELQVKLFFIFCVWIYILKFLSSLTVIHPHPLQGFVHCRRNVLKLTNN